MNEHEHHRMVDSAEPVQKPAMHHLSIATLYLCGASFALFLLISLVALIGIKAAFIVLFVLAGIAAVIWLVRGIIHQWHHHQDKMHLRQTVNEMVRQGHSVSVDYTTQKLQSVSPLCVPAGALTIKDVNLGQAELPAPMLELPAPYTLSSVLGNWQPSKSGILLASSAEQKLLTVPIGESLCHTSFTGRTGGGKTTKQRGLLLQLLFLQQIVYLCDRSFQRYRRDRHNGATYDYRPIENLLAEPPITQTPRVVELLKYLYSELEERRNTNRYMIKRHKDIYVVLDELPAFASEDKSIMGYVGKLLRESRQYGIFLCGASQDLLNTTLKNDNGAVRENLLTNFYDGGDPATARMVLDLQKNDKLDEAGLGTQGVSYLCAKGIALPHTRVRTPLADNEATFTLLGDMAHMDEPNSSTVEADTIVSTLYPQSYPSSATGYNSGYNEKPPGQPLDITNGDFLSHAQKAKVYHILEMDEQRKGQNAIIQEVWNVEPNTREGRDAADELRQIRAQMAADQLARYRSNA